MIMKIHTTPQATCKIVRAISRTLQPWMYILEKKNAKNRWFNYGGADSKPNPKRLKKGNSKKVEINRSNVIYKPEVVLWKDSENV